MRLASPSVAVVALLFLAGPAVAGDPARLPGDAPVGAGLEAPPSGPLDEAAAQVLRAREGLRRVAAFLRSRPALLDGRRKDLLTRDEKLALWGAWATALDHASVLEAYRGELRTWARAARGDPAAFAVGRAAFLASYAGGLDLISLVDRSAAAGRILDEEVPELGIPAGTWSAYKLHHLNAARATDFAALEVLARRAPVPAALAGAVEQDRAAIRRMGRGRGYALTAKNALAVVGRVGHAAWFPVQKGVSTWMGDTRVVRPVDSALVSPAQIAALPARLEPGDILLERREWYLSNLGLPGFWTHAALYVGTPEERRAFFDDPAVRALAVAEGQADGDLEALLAAREPSAAAASRRADGAGHPPRVLEAISEGVSFTSLEHSAAADSVAVLRPRLDRAGRARALLRAFHYAGRPYDFDFDFLTDAALVCSELVYKAYEPAPGYPGVRFELEELAGRRLASPNGMARQVDRELAAGAPQVELVVFLDGSEPGGGATDAGLDAFRTSWKRPKWYAVVPR